MKTRWRLGREVEAWLRSVVSLVVALVIAMALFSVVFLVTLNLAGDLFDPKDSTGQLIDLVMAAAAGFVAASLLVDVLFGRRPTMHRRDG